jgi:hypothetical protein
MFKLGDIIPHRTFEGEEEEHYIVVGVNPPQLEKVENYILRCFTVPYEGERCTLNEVVAREKDKILSRRKIDV